MNFPGKHPDAGADQGFLEIFSYIRRPGSCLGFKILNFVSFWSFQKNEYFVGYEDFVDIFGRHHEIGLYLGVISMHFSFFSLRSRYRIGDIFWLVKFLIYFWGA